MTNKFKEWLEIAQKYSHPMREAVRRFRHHKILTESTELQTGVYYWIPLPNGTWDLMKFFDEHYEDTMHTQIWQKEVLPHLAKLWNFTNIDYMRLWNAYAALPRGRVSKTQKGLANYHGNDAPTKNTGELTAIIKREFGLPSITSMFDEHEQMLPADKAMLQVIIKISY